MACAAPTIVHSEAMMYLGDLKGRNHGVILTTCDAEGNLSRCAVKPASRMDGGPAMASTAYVSEWVANAIAQALGLEVPTPHAVDLSPLTGIALPGSLEEPLGLNPAFGCEFRDGLLPVTSDALSKEMRQKAIETVAFDVFILNSDRRAINPNLGLTDKGFFHFDHDLAFDSVRVPIIGGQPAEIDDGSAIVEQHVLTSFLRKRRHKKVLLGAFRERVSSLTELWFDEVIAQTPSEWHCGDALEKIVRVLKARRDNVDKWLPEVEACLNP